MAENVIAVRLTPEQVTKLDAMAQITGWNRSEVIRRLIESASVSPPVVMSHLKVQNQANEPTNKGQQQDSAS